MRRAGWARRASPVRVVAYRSAAGLAADGRTILTRRTLFLNTRRPLGVGARVTVVLALQEPRCRMRLAGTVARVATVGNGLNEPPGMWLALDRPGPALAALLRRLAGTGKTPPRARDAA